MKDRQPTAKVAAIDLSMLSTADNLVEPGLDACSCRCFSHTAMAEPCCADLLQQRDSLDCCQIAIVLLSQAAPSTPL